MSSKQINYMWSASLLVIAVATLIIIVPSFVGIQLPDILKICLCVIEMVAVFILSYTTVKKRNAKR